MRSFLILSSLFALVTLPAYSGGVRVGNGGKVIAGINLKSNFKTKEEILDHIDSIVPLINSGNYERIKLYKKQGVCDSSFSGFDSVEFGSYYPVVNSRVSRVKEIVGHMKVILKDCKKWSSIKDDEPFNN